MNPYNDQIEPLPEIFKTVPVAPVPSLPLAQKPTAPKRTAPYHDIFILPQIGERVAAFGGYHWKVKAVDTEAQEVILEQDGLTTAGERVKASLKSPKSEAA